VRFIKYTLLLLLLLLLVVVVLVVVVVQLYSVRLIDYSVNNVRRSGKWWENILIEIECIGKNIYRKRIWQITNKKDRIIPFDLSILLLVNTVS